MAVAPPTVLTIAGSDSGGGAGLQADLRTLFACGVHGLVAVTAVTVQNTLGVTGYTEIPAEVVAAQVEAVATDIGVGAAKTGMLASAAIIEAVAGACDRTGIGRAIPFVVDPVAASMHGQQLLADSALDALRGSLFPRATLITPNLDEVRLLTGIEVRDHAGQRKAAEALSEFGSQWVLVKGGHLWDDPGCLDVLYDGSSFIELPGPRYDVKHTHGSGDTLASAIASRLARGEDVPTAVRFGKEFVVRSVASAYPLGAGVGPVSPLWRLGFGSLEDMGPDNRIEP
ncbi:bifunctional hydroxymethylpyrimidine kinase/phosphomethylpyrimidine kinase [Saccharothrix algeriensis]|uniref:Bifunctional hydroxymethylpyrimidine kinase/phosphomethylpyrimidine kinase n=1 Tax=Saccharothrix algeriensis TaxID=173560 RepID=A0A8T8I522_9PSEU|nr:bifunctional hydroxymethylpyrimidine kinase/phosphomethylpyrimidine kinase [Saccharothrix algeriensis]MBM7811758.1 hydroxymethylpyrimidine/phosphomethylpyrimidine kinase [Saccharothrix algeriensis]QTR05510.1 bifunctional hydroxymethylpyrimidine kinase/phosphomethylpyrimidine kinase [Saccharothrix algeriensis]